MRKVEVANIRVSQTIWIYREGSVLGGTVKSGCTGVDVHIEVESGAPRDEIVELIRLAKESCFTHGAMAEVVLVTTTTRLNGNPLDPPGPGSPRYPTS